MSNNDLQRQFAAAQETIRTLQEELAATNRGLLALTLELEQRVDERTQELHTAHAELERTNAELRQWTLRLEDRVAARTAELQVKSEEVRAMSQQLWQAARLATMGELAASIAHELNNPLATVSLRVEALLGQMVPDDPQRRSLEVVEQEVERMGNLVANLLQFTRRSAQQISTLDVREELECTLELIHYHLRNHRIIVIREFAPNVPLAQADRQQLRQLFLNLFTNASDAMSQGGTLTIRVSAMGSPPAPQVVIDIADTGGHRTGGFAQGDGAVFYDQGGRQGYRIGPADLPTHRPRASRHARPRKCTRRGDDGAHRAARPQRGERGIFQGRLRNRS